jgi:hypothetical protein
MAFFIGLVTGGLLGAYWTRPGGWLGGGQYYYPVYGYPGYAPYPYYQPYYPEGGGYYWYPPAAYYPAGYAPGYWYW